MVSPFGLSRTSDSLRAAANNVELLAQSGSWLVYRRKSALAVPAPAAPTAVRYVH